MISKPLFRLGDYVTVYSDLSNHKRYVMLHDPYIYEIATNDMINANSQRQRISPRSPTPTNEYVCENFTELWTDGMFVEGRRIMAYLNTEPETEYNERVVDNSFDFRSLLDNLDSDTCTYVRPSYSNYYVDYSAHPTTDIYQWACGGTDTDNHQSDIGAWTYRAVNWEDSTPFG